MSLQPQPRQYRCRVGPGTGKSNPSAPSAWQEMRDVDHRRRWRASRTRLSSGFESSRPLCDRRYVGRACPSCTWQLRMLTRFWHERARRRCGQDGRDQVQRAGSTRVRAYVQRGYPRRAAHRVRGPVRALTRTARGPATTFLGRTRRSARRGFTADPHQTRHAALGRLVPLSLVATAGVSAEPTRSHYEVDTCDGDNGSHNRPDGHAGHDAPRDIAQTLQGPQDAHRDKHEPAHEQDASTVGMHTLRLRRGRRSTHARTRPGHDSVGTRHAERLRHVNGSACPAQPSHRPSSCRVPPGPDRPAVAWRPTHGAAAPGPLAYPGWGTSPTPVPSTPWLGGTNSLRSDQVSQGPYPASVAAGGPAPVGPRPGRGGPAIAGYACTIGRTGPVLHRAGWRRSRWHRS